MCTRILWPDANGLVIAGRNMDFHKDLMTNLWTQPRGISRNDGVSGDFSWVSRYGSVVATALDMMSVDGLNEAGLAGHILWLAESNYGELDPTRPKLSQAIWLQYFLDNFSSVSDAVSWIEKSNVQIVQMNDPTDGAPISLHLALEDDRGDSCIIEYIEGQPCIYHSKEYRVMTNSPTYDQQLVLINKYREFGGNESLPGTTNAADRFARASYYLSRLPKPSSQTQAIASMFSVIRNVAQPFRIPELNSPEASQTLWQVVIDLTNQYYIFESTTYPNIIWIKMSDLNLAAGASSMKLNLVEGLSMDHALMGNVSEKFTMGDELTFLTVNNEKN